MHDNDPKPSKQKISAYAGRWVAWLKGRIVGQGGTPAQALQAAKSTRHKEIPQVRFVKTSSPISFSPLFEKVKKALPTSQPIYLVGGAVRDAVLNKKSHDLDFAMLKDAQKTARKVANTLQGAYYRLDDEHEAGRVVLINEAGVRQVIDFAVFRGPNLEEDLRGRDFTINALAVNVNNPDEILDPLGGMNDLFLKQIRPCSENSFSDDPLRTLRAIRFAATLKFKILAECKKGIRDAVEMLPEVSPERLRDELFKIFDAPQVATSLRAMDILEILPFVLPEVERMKEGAKPTADFDDVWEHSLQTVKKIERISNQLDSHYSHDNEEGGDLATGLIAERLGRYREQFTEHLNSPLSVERNYRPLLIFAALYHDAGKARMDGGVEGEIREGGYETESAKLAGKRAKAFHLSNAEINRITTIIQHESLLSSLIDNGHSPTRQKIYQFFRDTEEAGVSLCLFALADFLAIQGPSLKHEGLENILNVLRPLLEAYWDNYETQIAPPALVNGDDLIKIFDLPAGPIIGELLESVREAQAMLEINTREEALHFIRLKIKD